MMKGAPMERSEIYSKVVEVTVDILGIEEGDVSEETTFDDLNADSLDRLQLVTALEDEFGMELDDEKLLAISSVKDAVDAIESALEA